MTVFGLLVATLLLNRMRLRPGPSTPTRGGEPDALLVARLLALAVSAGRPLGRAFEDVRSRLSDVDRSVIDDLVVRASQIGLARALVETTGPLADLAERLAKTQVTGAPVAPALDAYISLVHDTRRARAIEEARLIGVKLVLPLTLLLLPGFIALVIAPFVFEQLDGLLGGGIP